MGSTFQEQKWQNFQNNGWTRVDVQEIHHKWFQTSFCKNMQLLCGWWYIKVWSLVHTYTVAFTESYLTSNLLNRTAPPRTLHQTRDPLINPVLAVDTLAIKRSARVIQRDVQDVYLSWWICVSLRHMARSQAPNEMYLYKIVMIVKKNPNNSRSHSHRSFSAVFPFQVGPLPAILQTLRFGHATAWAPARRGRDKLQNATLPATTTCSPFNALNLGEFGTSWCLLYCT